MSGTLAKIAKKRGWPCKLPNGEEIPVRPLELGETSRMKRLSSNEAKNGFALGKVLVEDDGSPSYPQGTDESDEEFGTRVGDTCQLDEPSIGAVMEAVAKASKTGKAELNAKNLPETAQPGSSSDTAVSPV